MSMQTVIRFAAGRKLEAANIAKVGMPELAQIVYRWSRHGQSQEA
jgi:hypothetical protein